MIQIKAMFDGNKVILPPDVHGSAVEVTVSFPDGTVDVGSLKQKPSAWDVIGKYTSTQTVEEMTRELRQDRDSWDE